jgi:hypothetical protein
LRGDPDDVARRVLDDVGLDTAMVEHLLEQMASGNREKRPGVMSNPAWHHVYGRAEGFAACLGTGALEPVRLLLAFLWDEREWQFAERQGVSRVAVVEALGAGVALPSAPMPELQQPIKLPPEGPPSTCQFCGGPIREGQGFVVPAKDRSWTAFFCSPSCALGFAVSALVAGGHVRGPEQLVLADEFGTGGSWYEPVRPPGTAGD